MPSRFTARLLSLALATAVLGLGCGDDTSSAAEDAGADGADADGADAAQDGLGDGSGVSEPAREYAAQIRWTSHGIPHVLADSWPDAAYGHARAFTRMHGCTLADQIMKVRGERARWLGVGEDDLFLASDIAVRTLGLLEDAERLLPELDQEIQDMLLAYATGYNDALDAIGVDALPEPCRGQPWVTPISDVELLAYYLNLGEFASGNQVIPFIANAQPPGSNKAQAPEVDLDELVLELPDFRRVGGGSNGWGLGSEYSETGRGMVLSNSHFPTQGDLQWFESHVTIPGEVNIYGVSLMGVFPINMGFNEAVAWTHTVSPGPRLTGYLLTLDRDDPTVYVYDGEPRAMISRTFDIEVMQEDGTVATIEHTSWYSHWGPILAVPPLGWTPGLVITFRNANSANDRMAAQWLAMNRADSLEEFRASFRDEGGIPWVHTIGADNEGTAYFIDAASVPALSETAEAQHREAMETDPFVQAGAELGFLLLDGSTSESEWDENADPSRPGLEPASAAPELLRSDFTSNSNDNHWLTNPLEPLVDFPYIYGGERQPQRLPRTRMSLRMLLETGPDSGRGDDDVFSLDEMLDTAMNGRAIFGELLKDEVAERCDGEQFVILNEDSVDITAACAALAGWDGRLTLDSRGAAVWREFIAAGAFDDEEWIAGGNFLFDVAFDPDDPVETPRGLARRPEGGDDPVLRALAIATTRLAEANIAPDARLGDIQFAPRGETNNARHGGLDIEGAFSISDYRVKSFSRDSTLGPGVPRPDPITARSGLTEEGYVVNAGNSWVAGIAFTDNGPVCQALMTTGQSEDPASPYFGDQAALFTTLSWRPCLYTEDAIAADPELRVEAVSSEE